MRVANLSKSKAPAKRMPSSNRVSFKPPAPLKTTPQKKSRVESLAPTTVSAGSTTTQAVTDGLTAADVDRLIEAAQHKQHLYGKVWQRFDLASFAELVGNIDGRGLDQEILLYQDMVLDGWHRYLACLRTNTEPRFVSFTGTDLEAAEKVRASGIRRHSTQEQRYASFVMLCEACPAFKQEYEQLATQGSAQKQAGKPVSTAGQRVDVLGAKAKAAKVSRGTAGKIERLKKLKKEAVGQIAAGKTTASKELKKLNGDNGGGGIRAAKPKQTEGDKGVASTTTASMPEVDVTVGPSLADLASIGGKLADLLKRLDHVKWDTEDQTKWGEVVLAIRQTTTHLSEKAEAGFKGLDQTKLRAVCGEPLPNENESQISVTAV